MQTGATGTNRIEEKTALWQSSSVERQLPRNWHLTRAILKVSANGVTPFQSNCVNCVLPARRVDNLISNQTNSNHVPICLHENVIAWLVFRVKKKKIIDKRSTLQLRETCHAEGTKERKFEKIRENPRDDVYSGTCSQLRIGNFCWITLRRR